MSARQGICAHFAKNARRRKRRTLVSGISKGYITMNKIMNRRVLALAALAAGMTAMSSGAFAQTVDVKDLSSMTTQLQGQMKSMATLAGYVSFLAGFVFGIMGIMKLKANAANPNDPANKVSTAIMLIFVGAAMIAVPTLMGVGVTSLFGSNGERSSLETGSGEGFTALD